MLHRLYNRDDDIKVDTIQCKIINLIFDHYKKHKYTRKALNNIKEDFRYDNDIPNMLKYKFSHFNYVLYKIISIKWLCQIFIHVPFYIYYKPQAFNR